MKLSPLQHLDAILEIMHTNSGGGSLLHISSEAKKRIPGVNVDILLDKLIKDGYLEKPWGDANPLNNTSYRLTLEGLLFYQKGGYRQEYKITKIRYHKDEVYTYSVAIGTALAGLYGLFEIGRWIFHHFHWHLPF